MGLPAGIDIRGESVRIRFYWNGRRYQETTPYPPTLQGIQASTVLRDQIKGLIKLNMLTHERLAELLPRFSQDEVNSERYFGDFAQLWLDSREITEGTRLNYKSCLNMYWMQPLARKQLKGITPALLRTIIVNTEWSSPGVKRNAIIRLRTILNSAVADGLIDKNPVENLELPKKSRKEVDPFSLDEANRIIERMYQHEHWPSLIYAAFYEFVFFTGLRLSEALALRWDAVDLEKRTAHICRTVALGKVEDRTKTNTDRFVLLNDRAMKALEFAKGYAERRRNGAGRIKETPYIFPPSKGQEHVKQTSDVHWQWRPTLRELGIRYRPPYNCRHTYATICIMSGMNPAFVAQQLGHSVQMLLSTYARWLNSSGDWGEMQKLQIDP
jgi:integrase